MIYLYIYIYYIYTYVYIYICIYHPDYFVQRKYETYLVKVEIQHHFYFSLACKHINTYGNISRKIVGEFISCCSTCSLKSIQTRKNPLKPIISAGFMERLQVMYILRFGDYQYYL